MVTTPLVLEEHPAAAAAHAGSTVTAGLDPDPSVVERAQTPATHHSLGSLPSLLSPLSSGWMQGSLGVAPFHRVL